MIAVTRMTECLGAYLSALPSMLYAAKVQGVPTNPMAVALLPTSALMPARVSWTNGSLACGSSRGVRAFTWSMLWSQDANQ